MWPNTRLLELTGIEHPIVQAPMAGASGLDMAVAVAEAGGLGSLPFAMLDAQTAGQQLTSLRQQTSAPVNVNFFCHTPIAPDPDRDMRWRQSLGSYYEELQLDPDSIPAGPTRAPFSEAMCKLVEQQRPEVVSFHFGLPAAELLERVKNSGAKVFSSATTVAEAVWLEQHGCDAIIAQGYEAGGHRGLFLNGNIDSQPGTLALVPQVVDAVQLPVIAAGGIADGRGMAAAFALGAAGVQLGTAYLFTTEAIISDLHRQALAAATDDQTALTNLFSGKPARGLMNRLMQELGPLSDQIPAFPTAGSALAPLKAAAERAGKTDFSSLWSGQSAAMGAPTDAASLTTALAADAQACMRSLNQRR